jgi:hypothetical protein
VIFDKISPMVKEMEKASKKYYECEECGLIYPEKEMSEKCQKWCSEHKSCNLDITKYAVKDFGGTD